MVGPEGFEPPPRDYEQASIDSATANSPQKIIFIAIK
jgi:hypothetical protein